MTRLSSIAAAMTMHTVRTMVRTVCIVIAAAMLLSLVIPAIYAGL